MLTNEQFRLQAGVDEEIIADIAARDDYINMVMGIYLDQPNPRFENARNTVTYKDTKFENMRFTSFVTINDVPDSMMNYRFPPDILECEPPETVGDSLFFMSAERALRNTSLGSLLPPDMLNTGEVSSMVGETHTVSNVRLHNPQVVYGATEWPLDILSTDQT